VTEVKFTLMPMTVIDVDATRPLMPLPQFKRHLHSNTADIVTDSTGSTATCINVRLHGHTQVLFCFHVFGLPQRYIFFSSDNFILKVQNM